MAFVTAPGPIFAAVTWLAPILTVVTLLEPSSVDPTAPGPIFARVTASSTSCSVPSEASSIAVPGSLLAPERFSSALRMSSPVWSAVAPVSMPSSLASSAAVKALP